MLLRFTRFFRVYVPNDQVLDYSAFAFGLCCSEKVNSVKLSVSDVFRIKRKQETGTIGDEKKE